MRAWDAVVIGAVAAFAVGLTPATAQVHASTDGQLIFDELCAECHGLGNDDGAGPDLLVAIGMPAEEFAAALTLMGEEYLDEPLTDAARAAITSWLRDQRAGGTASQLSPADDPPPTPAGGGDGISGSPEEGLALFRGSVRLAGGGAACAACHAAAGQGGTLGPDLDGYASTKPAAVVARLIEKSAFKVMRGAYGDGRQPTAREAAHLAAYLATLEPSDAPVSDGFGTVLVVAALAAIGAMLLLFLATRPRAGGTRARLVEESRAKVLGARAAAQTVGGAS